ncbi:universal stress protein [Streptomyces sp. NBC_00201]|uniref:universal stress protein n=1 Tax=unclassified Streptomyces TaxID=2593676 RepID=UPI0022540B7B|nr:MULTISPECIES: universal stress protein [unclassified Streptomyces]MCX5062748.1 universal stress protein [Streptomyces sp. NBC_00452]MCX5250427.1 universal stress protein [Streptomyces sp. NBC_00201]MCX5291646.1 universal stress protein [Streptomyces sp. NBC_00183]
MTGPVVVGVDGSPAGMTAAWWAASEALDRHLPVLLIHSWTTQPLNVPTAQEARSKQQHGREVLQRAEAELVHRYDGLAVTTQLVQAPAAQALLDHSERAALLVLGSRGHGSAASFLLGSISLHVLGLTQCPAVTVRADDPAVEAGWGHPAAAGRNEVVVGVQEPAAAADPLLEFAFTTAELHGTRVHAVRALPLFRPQAVPVGHDSGRHEVEARAQLTARLAPWREKFPDVPVVEQVTMGPAAQVVLSAATHGQLTVVGRRQHPSRLTWKLGPVAHAALHHVPGPVAVVPHD